MKIAAILSGLTVFLVSNSVAEPNAWPKLDKGHNFSHCVEALQIAEKMFMSDAFYLYAPPIISPDQPSSVALGPTSTDISGGDALKEDPSVFEKISTGEEPRGSMFWQRKDESGMRFILTETSLGWRGDSYSLFYTSKELTSDRFLDLFRKNTEYPLPEFNSIVRGEQPLLGGGRPPLIMRNKLSDNLWVIDLGSSSNFLGSWDVYSPEERKLKQICSVQFRPDVKNAIELLPPPVQKLATHLLRTIGSDVNEGTLKPIARQSFAAQHTWATLALRPWALAEPYNSREEVDAGLREWSLQNKTNGDVYRRIQELYGPALQSIGKYYQRTFNRSREESEQMASYALDIAFRNYYVFSKRRGSTHTVSMTNPWQKEK